MRSRKLGRKLLSGTLALGLCVTMTPFVPVTAVAAAGGEETPAVTAEPGAPELAVTGGNTWNGTDDIRVYVNADDSIAVDDMSNLVIAEGGDKYEIVDGHLKLKDGMTAENGDTITIQTEVNYYTEDQLLWSDGLETDNSLIPSTDYYGLNHTETMSRTGVKSGTPAPLNNSQDGVWTPDIDNTGRLVFWYYDPATEAEMDQEALAARDEFDQVKFGMAVNSYQALLLGVGIPASGDTGADGAKFADVTERLAYADTYTVRYNGNWNRTNIERSEGWHKMEIDVSSTGAKMYIDGDAVCLNGSEDQLVVSGVTTIEKAAVAVNWATKDEMVEFVNDKHFIDDMYILKSDAGEPTTKDLSATVTVQTSGGTENALSLVFGDDNTGALAKGETGRVYLENAEDLAIESVKYTTDNENITVSEDGTLSYAAGYTPAAGDTVQVTAEVTYYDPEGVVFVDSFEGDKKFTDGDSATLYKHSTAGSLYGRQAATADTTSTGSPSVDIDSVSDVTVTAWYYDANGGASQTKFGFGINDNDNAPLGVFYDGSISALVDGMTETHYGTRVKGYTYNNYGFGTTDVERSTGWHKFQWIIDSENGLTMTIDDQVISTNTIVGTDQTDMDLVKVENNSNITELNRLAIRENWNNNATNMAEISDRHFIDGVSVVKNGTETTTETVVSVEIPLQDIEYTVNPASLEVDSTYPEDQTVYINPYVENDTDVAKVLIDDTEVSTELWTAGMGEAPENAQNYPDEMLGYRLIVDGEAFKDLSDGAHTLTIVTAAGSEITVDVAAYANEHVPTDYYLSNNDGDDSNDGHSPETAWKSFEKLQSVTFGPGDHIYLDAQSTWSGVQFRPEGSGAEGAPIVLTKYNDGGDSSKRPILNGDGTIADLDAHSYLAFDAWRKFYPSGTIELINVEQWEIRGIEVTNYAEDMQKGAVGRNGIAIIYDYYEVQGLTELPASNAAKEEAFYRAGKAQHFVVDDCYVHDVTGYHPINGAVGAGGKMSGGINAYGPMDDLQINNNIVMYCDVEGIRNDVLAWMGDTRTQFPAYMEDVSISNNYIAGVPGDGVVISSADQPILENNYLTDAGYSYYAKTNTSNVSGVTWSTGNLASCRAVEEYTGGTVKAMGNRQDPITMGSTNFAGLWFIGTKDAVAQYNEAVNNVWVCNDSEAFDADMFCWGTIFQYNYTYRNNGGFLLTMSTMDDGTIVRYNVSVEDAQSVGISESQNGLFHYCGAADAIYNNLFILGDKVATMFGGPSNEVYFYNNIVVAPNGLTEDTQFGGFHINGSSDGTIQNPRLSGEMTNNLFYPSQIVDSVVEGSTVTLKNNISLDSEDELKAVFEDLDGFMDAQPVKALLGRSDFTGDPVDNLEGGKGAGVAMSPEAGRSVQTPTGGFDLTQFEGIKLADESPAIGAGKVVDREYEYKEQNDLVNPLKVDFFGNDISEQEIVDIGPFQYSYAEEEPEETVSKKTLEYFLKEAKGLVEDGSVNGAVDSVKQLFEEAIAEGEAVMAKEDATREEVQNASLKLMLAIHALNMKAADKTDLEMALELAESIDLTKYVEEGQEEFLAAKEEAQKVMDDSDAMQPEVDAAWDALVEAMSALRLKADKSALEDLINSVQGIDLGKYTTASAAAFEKALAKAQSVVADEALSEDNQQVVDDAVKELQAAYTALEEKDNGSGGQGTSDSDQNTSGTGNSDQTTSGTSDGNKAGSEAGSASAVKTGDSAPIVLWAVIVIVAAGAAAGVLTVRKRRSGR